MLLSGMMKRYWLRIGIVFILCLISWAAYVSSKQLARNQRIESEVDMLKQEADKIRRENETLSEKVRYFASNDFQEQEAKDKLGMKKTGEEVIVIKSRKAAEEKGEVETPVTMTPAVYEGGSGPNYKKWWRIFFPAS
jgi:cell division protein FtsB